jgi:hypothetical protein
LIQSSRQRHPPQNKSEKYPRIKLIRGIFFALDSAKPVFWTEKAFWTVGRVFLDGALSSNPLKYIVLDGLDGWTVLLESLAQRAEE